MLWSFAHLAVRNVLALVWLLARPLRSKELEILVLRYETRDAPSADSAAEADAG